MARFFVPGKNLRDKKGTVSGQELEHMRKVLRMRPGDRVLLFDDEGWEHEGIIRSYTEELGEVEILSSFQPRRESSLDITLAQALGKGEKMDLVVEKATELGVRTIVPFVSSRTVPKLDRERMVRRQARWKKIALSATKQCGRTRIPELLDVSDLAELLRRPWPCQLKLLFWEGESRQGLAQIRQEKSRLDSVLLVVGPEGGFSAEEASEAIRHGFQSVRLGERILRTETAALAALSIVQFLWGDIG
ncbi:MAG: 16S rRNA (uracil(1498)-N(3))-methyltransferase [Deltaproteobacteria bacterium]|nr:16S rRNA (uracil(1498)-N(3))-methyltransferase [Deltaproteobacteria bacterium]